MHLPQQSENTTDDELTQKRVAFYQEMVSGWFSTQVEADKQAMGLSGLAIGLLMTFTHSVSTRGEFVLWSLAGISFLTAILFGMRVLHLNARYLEEVVGGENELVEAQVVNQLSKMTNLIYTFFIIGAVLTAVLAASSTTYLQTCGACQ